MNIIDAIKSGKQIKRAGWDKFEFYEQTCAYEPLHVDDILADDWEVEETEVTINRSILSAVWKRAKERTNYTIEYHGLGAAVYIPDVDLEDLVAEELGL